MVRSRQISQKCCFGWLKFLTRIRQKFKIIKNSNEKKFVMPFHCICSVTDIIYSSAFQPFSSCGSPGTFMIIWRNQNVLNTKISCIVRYNLAKNWRNIWTRVEKHWFTALNKFCWRHFLITINVYLFFWILSQISVKCWTVNFVTLSNRFEMWRTSFNSTHFDVGTGWLSSH